MKTATTPSKIEPAINTDSMMEIFRAGTHVAVDGKTYQFSDADIQAIASNYDPALSEAAFVIGHPKIDGPAYGWVKSLHAERGRLFAEPHQMDATFAEMVNAGRFKKRSASLYGPETPNNPMPGHLYIKHVGFLGAAAPAVKGLRDYSFSDGVGCLEFSEDVRWYTFGSIARIFRGLRDRLIETDSKEVADAIIPDYYITDIQDAARPPSETAFSPNFADTGIEALEDTTVTEKNLEFAERETRNAAKEKEVADREAAVAATEEANRRKGIVDFADSLVSEGKLLPKQKASVIELLMALPKDQNISFAEGDATVSKGTEDVLRDFLTGLPKQIDFAEKSGGEKTAIDFADSNAIAAAANEFQSAERNAGREVSTAQAVQHITQGNK